MSFGTPPSSDDWGFYVDTRTNSTHWLAAPPPERAPLPIGQIIGHAPKQWWERKLEVETFKRVGKARRQLRQRHRRSSEKEAAFESKGTDLPNAMSHPGPNLSSFEPEWFTECWQECRRAKVVAPRATSRRKPSNTAPLLCVSKAPPTRLPQNIRRVWKAVPTMPPQVSWQSAHEAAWLNAQEPTLEPEGEPESEESTGCATPSAGMPRMSAAAPAFTPATTLVPQYTEVYCRVPAVAERLRLAQAELIRTNAESTAAQVAFDAAYTEVCHLVVHCCRCGLWGPSQCCAICGSWVCSLHESALDHPCFGHLNTGAAEEAACEVVLLRTVRDLVG
jgi:hypothetical protein